MRKMPASQEAGIAACATGSETRFFGIRAGSRSFLSHSYRLRCPDRFERMIQICDQVVDIFDSHREANHLLGHAHLDAMRGFNHGV